MKTQDHAEQSTLAWLTAHEKIGTTEAAALAFFDSLPIVTVAALLGRWRGSGLPTGHPFDGLLESYGWYGKEFLTPDHVHPLLFTTGSGGVVPVESRYLPTGLLMKLSRSKRLLPALFSLLQPLLRTRKPGARLRMMEHRSKVSAAMIYDHLPIHDMFRRIDEDTVLGLMDLRNVPRPFFFVLRRAPPGRDL